MIDHICFNDSLNLSQSINIIENQIKPVYVLSNNSLINENINFKQLINKQISSEKIKSISNPINLNINSEKLINLQKNKEEFYIVDKIFFTNMGFNEKLLEKEIIFYFNNNSSQKFLIFSREKKVFMIESQKKENKLIQDKYNDDIRIDILESLILLYANEKELDKFFNSNIEDECDLKKYYLVNKKWINTFKDKFNYNQIYQILSQYNQNKSYKWYEKNINSFLSNEQLKNIVLNYKQIPDILKKEIKLFPEKDKKEIKTELQYPIEFELIPKSLFNLLKQMIDSIKEINPNILKHKIIIGNLMLFIQNNNNPKVFYIYCYENNSYNIYSIVNYFQEEDFYKEINKYINKNYDKNKLNIIQNILDSNNKIIGGYVLKYGNNNNIKEDNINYKYEKYYSIYQNYMKYHELFSSQKSQNLDLSNIDNIEIYLSENKLDYLLLYLVEESQINYYINDIFRLYYKLDNNKDNKNNEDIISELKSNISKNNLNLEILSEDNLDSKKSYSLIDENFCIDINLPKDRYKPFEVLYFVNQENKYLYFRNSKNLLIISNFNKFLFNISKINFISNKDKILELLIELYNKEKEINNLLKGEIFNHSIKCYIINKTWMEEFKKFYNYNNIIQKINENDEKIDKNYLLSLLGNKKFPDYFKDEKNLIPQNDKIYFTESKIINYPINFEIIQKDIFDNILKEINIINNFNLCNEYSYQIIFVNNRIYSKNEKNYFYIGSLINKTEYKINYLMISNDTNTLNDIFNPLFFSYKDNDEKYFTHLGLDLSLIKKVQNIKTNNNFICYFISIFPLLKELNHCLGLQNVGATCYMNATLQCLCHITSLKNYFNNDEQIKKDINKKNVLLTKSFYEVIHNLWKVSDISYYAPNNFKNLISELNPLFKGIKANDSKDLIIFIYENLHNELNNPNPNYLNSLNSMNIPQELKIFRQNYFSKNNSIITKIFYSEQSSNMTCNQCHINKLSFNIISFLIFPLEKVRLFLEKKKYGNFQYVSLEDCFDQNEEIENLNGQNQIYCNNCKRSTDAISYNKLYTCPEVLTIILNRGKGLEFEVEFQFPMNLNIDKYVVDKSNNTNYELIGVITHLGESGMSGHFIAYCKSPVDKNWYMYNDAIVQRCINPENEINSRGIPYVLYYQRISKIQNPNDNNCISLYFNYNEKEGFLDYPNGNDLLYNFINQLHNKYNWLPTEGVNFYIIRDGMKIQLDTNKGIFENGIKNGEKIIIS